MCLVTGWNAQWVVPRQTTKSEHGQNPNTLLWSRQEPHLERPKKVAVFKMRRHLRSHKCLWDYLKRCVLLSGRNCSRPIKNRNWHHPQVTDCTTVGFQIRPDDGTDNFQLTYSGEEPISLDSHQETTTCYPSHILPIWNCFDRTVSSEISIYVHFKGSKWIVLKSINHPTIF